MIAELFLTSALALPMITVRPTTIHKPTIFDLLMSYRTMSLHNGRMLIVGDNAISRTVMSHGQNAIVYAESESFWPNVLGDPNRYPFKTEVFDVLWRVENDLNAMGFDEMRRILAPGGFLVIKAESLIHKLLVKYGFFKLPFGWLHYRIYQKNSIRKKFKPPFFRHLILASA